MAGETYGFNMWLEVEAFGSENYWPDWKSNNGFSIDGNVIGQANKGDLGSHLQLSLMKSSTLLQTSIVPQLNRLRV